VWGMRRDTSESTRSAPPVATMRLNSRTYAVSSSMVLHAASTLALASCAERLAAARARSARGEAARRASRLFASEASRRCAATVPAAAAFRFAGTGMVITCMHAWAPQCENARAAVPGLEQQHPAGSSRGCRASKEAHSDQELFVAGRHLAQRAPEPSPAVSIGSSEALPHCLELRFASGSAAVNHHTH
jgi:hypothetical protein